MSADELTVEEVMGSSASRARERAAEEYFYRAAQPHYPLGFSVYQRNHGHWDVSAAQCPGKVSAWLAAHPGGQTTAKDGQAERAFRIRGEPGNVLLLDERWCPLPESERPATKLTFKTVDQAMAYVVGELMREPLPRGQSHPVGTKVRTIVGGAQRPYQYGVVEAVASDGCIVLLESGERVMRGWGGVEYLAAPAAQPSSGGGCAG